MDQPGAPDPGWLKQGDRGGQHGCVGHWGLYSDHGSGMHGVTSVITCLVIGWPTAKPSLAFLFWSLNSLHERGHEHLRARRLPGFCLLSLAIAWEQDMIVGIRAIGKITKNMCFGDVVASSVYKKFQMM